MPNGKPKRYSYDAFGELIRVEELNPANPGNFNVGNLIETARYTYDAAGRVTLVQMGRSGNSFTQTRTFTYSAYSSNAPFGLLASATTPEKGTVSYAHNSTGTLLSKTDAKGQTLWYAYDSNHRLLIIITGSSQSSATTVTQFTYDTATNGIGKMATAAAYDLTGYTSGVWTWSYSYDILGNVNGQTLQTPFTEVTNIGSLAITPSASYTYDSDSKLTGMVAPGSIGSQYSLAWQPGNSYQYTYDTAGRPTGMNQLDTTNQTWDITVASNGTHNAAGQLTGWQEGYTALARSYDPARGWLTSLTAGHARSPVSLEEGEVMDWLLRTAGVRALINQMDVRLAVSRRNLARDQPRERASAVQGTAGGGGGVDSSRPLPHARRSGVLSCCAGNVRMATASRSAMSSLPWPCRWRTYRWRK
jgi:YD repeat-containing protein